MRWRRYQCEYQDEIMKALWTCGSVNIMTTAPAVTENCETKTAVICTHHKNKDKYVNGLFIEFMYVNWIKSNDDIEEIIWSHGRTSEFKNRYYYYYYYYY